MKAVQVVWILATSTPQAVCNVLLLCCFLLFIIFVFWQKAAQNDQTKANTNIQMHKCTNTQTLDAAYYGAASAGGTTFTLHVLLDCSKVFFEFTDDDDSDAYSSWGIGGDYSGNGAAQMDGYCIVIQDDYAWETVLDGSAVPEEQSSQDLTCTQSASSGTRTTLCKRDYETSDDDDWDSYTLGTNQVIWASLVLSSVFLF